MLNFLRGFVNAVNLNRRIKGKKCRVKDDIWWIEEILGVRYTSSAFAYPYGFQIVVDTVYKTQNHNFLTTRRLVDVEVLD